MANIPCLGSKISLISKSEIRYEGILYTVDPKENTVALAKVKSLGTEDRPTNRPVAPRDEVYEYIIFRASDIKDLHIPEAPKPPHSLPHGLAFDPAIVQSSVVPSYPSLPFGQPFSTLYGLQSYQPLPAQPSFSNFPILTSGHYSGGSSRAPTPTQRKSPTSDAGVQVSVTRSESGQERSLREPREQFRPRDRGPSNQNYQNRWRSNSQNRQQGRRSAPRRGRGRQNGPQIMERFESEYDFEQANAEFLELENKLSKVALDGPQETSPGAEDLSGTYDRQKSFFDDISCEASQRSKGLPRFDWRVERKLNVETFGVSANNAWIRRRRARGGFRRGFRGRGGSFRPTNDGQKTVTFNETPTIKEVEVITLEEKPEQQMPVIEVIADKTEWLEPKAKPEEVVD